MGQISQGTPKPEEPTSQQIVGARRLALMILNTSFDKDCEYCVQKNTLCNIAVQGHLPFMNKLAVDSEAPKPDMKNSVPVFDWHEPINLGGLRVYGIGFNKITKEVMLLNRENAPDVQRETSPVAPCCYRAGGLCDMHRAGKPAESAKTEPLGELARGVDNQIEQIIRSNINANLIHYDRILDLVQDLSALITQQRIDELENFEPLFKGNHSKCPDPTGSCIGYQNAESDFYNEKQIRLSKLREDNV